MTQQYAGPFRDWKLGQLAYKVRVHDVFTIAQLEPPVADDPFQRPLPEEHRNLSAENGEPRLWLRDFSINEKGGKHTVATECQVKRRGFGAEFDQWVNTKKINSDEDSNIIYVEPQQWRPTVAYTPRDDFTYTFTHNRAPRDI